MNATTNSGQWVKLGKDAASFPPKRKNLLLMMPDGHLKIGYFYNNRDGEGDRWASFASGHINFRKRKGGYDYCEWPPTHWMLIPRK